MIAGIKQPRTWWSSIWTSSIKSTSGRNYVSHRKSWSFMIVGNS